MTGQCGRSQPPLVHTLTGSHHSRHCDIEWNMLVCAGLSAVGRRSRSELSGAFSQRTAVRALSRIVTANGLLRQILVVRHQKKPSF